MPAVAALPTRPPAQRKGVSMHSHGPNVLTGPFSRKRSCWMAADEAPIRQELVQRIRREIAAGTYDTPEKWQAALDRLGQRLREE